MGERRLRTKGANELHECTCAAKSDETRDRLRKNRESDDQLYPESEDEETWEEILKDIERLVQED